MTVRVALLIKNQLPALAVSNALSFLGADKLESETALETLGAVVKDHEDQQVVAAHLQEVLGDDNA